MADGFVGGTYNLNSVPASAQRTINMMPVPVEAGNERTAYTFRDVPGLLRFAVKDYIYITSQPYAYEADESMALRATVPSGGGLFSAMPFEFIAISTVPFGGVLKSNLAEYQYAETVAIGTLPQTGALVVLLRAYTDYQEEKVAISILPQTGALTVVRVLYSNYAEEQVQVSTIPQSGQLL